MEKWVIYAFVSMVFAGLTSVIAKQGLTGISGELGLAVRTCFVFAFVGIFSLWVLPRPPHVVLVSVYIGMGSFAMLNLLPFAKSIGASMIAWAFAGTLIYAFGGICDDLAAWIDDVTVASMVKAVQVSIFLGYMFGSPDAAC